MLTNPLADFWINPGKRRTTMKVSNLRFIKAMIALCLVTIACTSGKVYAAKPKILICGKAGKHVSERKMLEKYGFKVTVASPRKVNTDNWDGLVLPGSKKNIFPKLYGAKKDPHTHTGSLQLDLCQIRTAKKFMKAKKPILGICRGCQLINVATGGTLIQHIGTKRGGTKSGRWKGYHHGTWSVKIKKGSWLYDTFGSKVSVSHSHQQCPARLGKDMIATQWDTKSGLIEAIEHKTLPVYGLQWHPDLMRGTVPRKVCKKFRQAIQESKKAAKAKKRKSNRLQSLKAEKNL